MAVKEPNQWVEPNRFRIGDTLKFNRMFDAYLPSDGWSCQYSLVTTGPGGGKTVLQFVSVPDSTNYWHTVDILNFGDGLADGDYEMIGELVCSPTGEYPNERRQFYLNRLVLGADLQNGLGDDDQCLTFARQMLSKVEAQLLLLGDQVIDASNLQRNEITFTKRKELMEQRRELKEEIHFYENRARIANGRTSMNDLVPLFR